MVVDCPNVVSNVGPRDGVVETTAAAGWLKAKPASGRDGEGEERPRSGGSMTVKTR